MVALLQRKRSYYLRKLKIIQRRRLARKKRQFRFTPGKTDQWWRNMISGETPEEQWVKNFRMTRKDFFDLVRQLQPYISPDESSPNYRLISAEKKGCSYSLLPERYGLFGNDSYNTFGIAICTASCEIYQVCNIISKVLGPKYLKLPKTASEMRQKVSEFEAKFDMVQAFGCIDGTHVPIKRPVKDPQDYYCYKGFYSLNVQAVCDYRGIFMDVDCRWSGSVHDANSSISHKLREQQLPQTFQTLIPGLDKIPNYLIGDPSYPLTPYCMKEFETCNENAQVVLNGLLRAARSPIECAFGRLKAAGQF